MKEEWKTVVIDGKENPWYSVSNLGNVRSHLQVKGKGDGGGFYSSYNPNYYKNMSPKRKKQRSYSASFVIIQCPEDFFEDYQYYKLQDNSPKVSKTCHVHQLVMSAFRPMDEHPPDKLKKCWNNIPEDAKNWIKQTVYINHIDHDPSNNHVDNLEYVTPRENSHAAVKYYGGNTANKNKEDDWIKIIEPFFNPLLQEYEDGEIQFIGQEGEKYYNMLEEIAKARGKSPSETFFKIIKEQQDKIDRGEYK